MGRKFDDHDAVRRYLLRQLTDSEQQDFELRLLSEAELAEELDIAEDELIDEYLDQKLTETERESFERDFLASPARQRKLVAAEALHRYLGTIPPKPAPAEEGLLARLTRWFQQSFFSSPLAVAAALVIVVGLGFLGWRLASRRSAVDEGLVALNAAYDRERPTEARITQFSYAPFVTTRGAAGKSVNEAKRDRAELTFRNALNERPTPALHHALGKVYLAKSDFDRAIAEFEEARKGDANNALIYADLGAAYLEKGKLGITGNDEARAEAGKGLADLGRALENLTKALELQPSLLEALFNRALCEQKMTLYAKAEEDWRLYLQKDSSSRWAEEARQNLKALEERTTRATESEDQLRQNFLQAFKTRNDSEAWIALTRSQRRAGNSLVEQMLDEYLEHRLRSETEAATRALQVIKFAGDVQSQKIGERYTFDLAKIYGECALQKCQSLAAARNQMKLASASFNKNEFDEAVRLFSAAEAAFAKINDTPEALFARSWVGVSTLRLSQAEAGVQIFEELSTKFEARGYKFFQAVALTALGDAYATLNEFSKRLDYANRALVMSELLEDHANVVRCQSHRLGTYLILNDEEKSLDAFLRATARADYIPPDPKLVWPLYYEAALDFHFLGLPSSALAFAQEAMSLANAADVGLLRSRSWERLGVIYGKQGNFDAAIDSGNRALAEAAKISGDVIRNNMSAHSALVLGELHAAAGEAKQSLEYFDQSIKVYEGLKSEAYSYRSHKGKLLALIAQHDDGHAEAELETVLALFEGQRQKIVEESNRDKFFDSGQDTYDVAISFALSHGNDYAKALGYAEASRARSLFEMMGNGVNPINSPDGKELLLRGNTAPLTVAEIQQQMPAAGQLLEYAALPDRLVMWVVTPSAVKGAQVSIEATKLDENVRRYVSLLSEHNPSSAASDQIRAEGRKLSESLLAPVQQFLDPAKQLCIVPDKSLNFLPFAALLNSSGKYLVEDFQLEQAASANVFVRSSTTATAKERTSAETLLSVGNPALDSSKFNDLADLPEAEREAKEVASFYKEAMVLTGADASRSRVIRDSARADVIHFATHAISDPESPLASKLVLASDSTSASTKEGDAFEAFDIYGLQLPRTRLIVLSACQTGIEHSYKGEGAVGLARPFIAAGVPLVVATLWPVESDATAVLMISFHRYRKTQELSTVAALRMAQLDMIHHSPNSKNGYGWAAFTAIGGYATY
jgi:CHAT domain-containing protein